ncbi:MAG TPA: hypothetical protein VMS76_05970, partial [Planctomycetota bacterium]|nr:hypothetical protein [Planctomycetota bacterium]
MRGRAAQRNIATRSRPHVRLRPPLRDPSRKPSSAPARLPPTLAAALLLFGLLAYRTSEPERDERGVAALRWLSGTWAGDLVDSTYEEHWS